MQHHPPPEKPMGGHAVVLLLPVDSSDATSDALRLHALFIQDAIAVGTLASMLA